MHLESKWLEKRVEQACTEKTSCMSNAKWRRLLKAIQTDNSLYFIAELKLMHSDAIYPFRTNPGLHPSGEGTADSAAIGPIQFRDIEWLSVPAVADGTCQDIGVLRKLLDNLGRFDYICDEERLIIFGYR